VTNPFIAAPEDGAVNPFITGPGPAHGPPPAPGFTQASSDAGFQMALANREPWAIAQAMAQNPKISPYALRQHEAILAANTAAQAPPPSVLSDLWQMGKQTVEHPINTITGMAKAVGTSALAPGRYLGQAIASRVEPQSYAAWLAQGGQPVTGQQAALGTAQTLANVIAPELGGLLGGGLVGAAYGAGADTPQEAAANVIAGAGLGGGLAALGRLRGGKVEVPPPAAPPDAIAQAFADVAKEQAGTPPADLPEGYLNQRFAERMQQGAQDAGTAPAPATMPLSGDAQATSDFAQALQNGAVAAPTKKIAPAEGVETPADVVARQALQAYYQAAGFVRRPGEAEPGALPEIPPEAMELAMAAGRGAVASENPFIEPTPSPESALPSYPEGFAMGGPEGRIPELPPQPALRGSPPPAGIAVTPEVENYLGNEPPEFASPPGRPGTAVPEYPTGAPRALRPGEPLLNPRTFDPSRATQGALADAVGQLQEQGVSKARVPIAEQMQQTALLGKSTLRDLGIDPNNIDMNKVKNLSGPQILDLKNRATTAMDQVVALSKELERPDLPPMQRPALESLYEQAKQERDGLLESVMVASGQKGRDLNFLKQVSTKSLDPDVWVHQARRLSGDTPLSDDLIARIRRLALEAAEACA